MMEVKLENAGKRFRKDWIFRSIDLTLKSGGAFAVCGMNGSGKSTLAQAISGYLTLTEGKVSWGLITPEDAFSKISFAAPYLDLPEEFTLIELLRFHFAMRPSLKSVALTDIPLMLGLKEHVDKPVNSFSSGMKQRLKLGLALLTDSDLILLDEPCTNLDANGKKWYKEMLNKWKGGRTLVVFSNHMEEEIAFCLERFEMEKFKP